MQKIFDVQQFVKGRAPVGCKLYIGAYGENPVDNPSVVYTAVEGGREVPTPLSLGLDGRPMDQNGCVIEVYADGAYSMQIVDQYGVHILNPPWQVLNAGGVGPAGTVAIGNVETLLPSQPAYVNNVGTATAAVLGFGIPQGPKGDPGSTEAVGVYYDNSASGIDATNVQDAIDVLAQGSFDPSSDQDITGDWTFTDLGGAQYGGTLTTPLGPIPVYRNISFASQSGDVDVNLIDTVGLFDYEILKDVFALDSSQLEEDDRVRVSLSKLHDWDNENAFGTDDLILAKGNDGLELVRNMFYSLGGGGNGVDVVIAVNEAGRREFYVSAKTIDLNADEVTGLQSRTGTLPLTFDIDRNYGTEASPITGNLGWTASVNDKPVSHIVIHQDSAPPAELANMKNLGSNTYINGAKNLISITCVVPNVTYTYVIGYLS